MRVFSYNAPIVSMWIAGLIASMIASAIMQRRLGVIGAIVASPTLLITVVTLFSVTIWGHSISTVKWSTLWSLGILPLIGFVGGQIGTLILPKQQFLDALKRSEKGNPRIQIAGTLAGIFLMLLLIRINIVPFYILTAIASAFSFGAALHCAWTVRPRIR